MRLIVHINEDAATHEGYRVVGFEVPFEIFCFTVDVLLNVLILDLSTDFFSSLSYVSISSRSLLLLVYNRNHTTHPQVEPFSVKHTYDEWRGATTQLNTCNPLNK